MLRGPDSSFLWGFMMKSRAHSCSPWWPDPSLPTKLKGDPHTWARLRHPRARSLGYNPEVPLATQALRPRVPARPGPHQAHSHARTHRSPVEVYFENPPSPLSEEEEEG